MIEKRFIQILEKYKEQVKDMKLTPNTVERLLYIQKCLDHIENEIDDLNLDMDKPENKMYDELIKVFSPFMIQYMISKSE